MQSKMGNHENFSEQIKSRPGRVKAQTIREWVYEYSQGGESMASYMGQSS